MDQMRIFKRLTVFLSVSLVLVFAHPAQARSSPTGGDSLLGLERLTFDVGLSAGSSAGRSYTEAGVGVNAYFSEYLAWRNAVWARFIDNSDNVYGLDSSLRGIFSVGNARGGFTAFAGPGFRFASKGDSSPFAEGGLVVKLGGVAIGGGVKSVFNSWVHTNAENDTQVFLILAGGGTL